MWIGPGVGVDMGVDRTRDVDRVGQGCRARGVRPGVGVDGYG